MIKSVNIINLSLFVFYMLEVYTKLAVNSEPIIYTNI